MLGGAECLYSSALPLYVKGAAQATNTVLTPPAGVHMAAEPPAMMGQASVPMAPFVPLGPAPQNPVYYSAPYVAQQSAPPTRVDSFVVEVYVGPNAMRMGRRELEVRVRDVSDPLSLLVATLGEEEYAALRREQRLLVDFAQFPQKLLELLQQCTASASDERPLFYAALVQGAEARAADLVICESTSFRQIVHLTLRLRGPPDAVLRRHVSEVVRQYQDELRALRGDDARPGPPQVDLPVPGGPAAFYTPPGRTTGLDAELKDLRGRVRALQDELRRTREGNNVFSGAQPPLSPPDDGILAAGRVNDIHTANDVIRRLQDAVRSARARASTSETALRELQTETDALRRDHAATSAERDRLARERERDEERIRVNDEVVAWQWKRISELEAAAGVVHDDYTSGAPLPDVNAGAHDAADSSYRWFKRGGAEAAMTSP